MALIKGKNTRPELRLRRALHQAGLRYRLHAKDLPGSPDIVFRPSKLALFVHGCYWHRHKGCRLTTTPKTNSEFWLRKFSANVARDSKVRQELESLGWKVFIAWECQTRDDRSLFALVEMVREEVLLRRRHKEQR